MPLLRVCFYTVKPQTNGSIEYRKNNNSGNGRGDPSPTKETAKSIESVVGWLKYQITKEINKIRNTTGEKIFQRSFYDHVIRDREDYDSIYK